MTKDMLIGVLTIVSVFFLIYSSIKANEAEKYQLEAQVNLEGAIRNEERAKEQEQRAVEAAAQALIEKRRADDLEKQLEDCK